MRDANRTTTAKRVTVNLRQSDVERLDYIAEQTGLSRNDSIRKALATEAWVGRTRREGRKVLVEDGKGRLREVVWTT